MIPSAGNSMENSWQLLQNRHLALPLMLAPISSSCISLCTFAFPVCFVVPF